DVDVGAGPVIGPGVAAVQRQVCLIDAIEPPARRIGLGIEELHFRIRLDIGDMRIVPESLDRCRRERGGKALQGPLIGAVKRATRTAGEPARRAGHVSRSLLEYHDMPAGSGRWPTARGGETLRAGRRSRVSAGAEEGEGGER